MWHIAFGEGEPPTSPPQYWGPPSNEIPAVVPLRVDLFRTADLAVVATHAEVTTIGWTLRATGRIRSGSGLSFFGRFHHGMDEDRLFGVAYADGRSGWDGHGRPGPDEPPDGGLVVRAEGGGGSTDQLDLSWWIAPLPPPGAVTLALRIGIDGVGEQLATMEAAPVAAAAARVVALWPWTPPVHDEPEPPPWPELPTDSWFRRFVDG